MLNNSGDGSEFFSVDILPKKYSCSFTELNLLSCFDEPPGKACNVPPKTPWKIREGFFARCRYPIRTPFILHHFISKPIVKAFVLQSFYLLISLIINATSSLNAIYL